MCVHSNKVQALRPHMARPGTAHCGRLNKALKGKTRSASQRQPHTEKCPQSRYTTCQINGSSFAMTTEDYVV